MRIREYAVTSMPEATHAPTQSVFMDAPSPRTSYPLSSGMLGAVAQGDAIIPCTYNTTPSQVEGQLHIATDAVVPGIQLPSPRPTPESATPHVPNGRARRLYRGLPSQIEGGEEAVMHPLLERVPDIRSVDFSQSWEIIKAAWPPSSLYELATSPPLPSLAVVIHRLPWAVVIQPDADQCYVTVGDVIFRIWECLHFPLEMISAGTREVDEEASEVNKRLRVGADNTEQRTQGRAKRLVYLRGRTRFLGLKKETNDGDTWVMIMA
ncbi:hypothetical protein CPB85DRAFT_1338354 [Mucidula mucida]|nr:hypothetical protein CPB85DRAFT_1338354 [Mucidula mucida]